MNEWVDGWMDGQMDNLGGQRLWIRVVILLRCRPSSGVLFRERNNGEERVIRGREG